MSCFVINDKVKDAEYIAAVKVVNSHVNVPAPKRDKGLLA